MLRWTIAFTINRLLMVVVILFTLKVLGVSSARFESPLRDVFNIISPFDVIANALK